MLSRIKSDAVEVTFMVLFRYLTFIYVTVGCSQRISASPSFHSDNFVGRPNVLFIVIDDLRPSLNSYGGPILSPNIDQLAAQSAVFQHAMAQQAICGPSRISFLTGRRPDTTKLYDFYSYWRDAAGNYTTLPQHFKENGYFAASIGKVFHNGKASNHTDDYPYSWSVEAWHPPTQKYKRAKVCKNQDGTLHENIICPVTVTEMPLGSLPDIQSTDYALDLLQQFASKSPSPCSSFRKSGPKGSGSWKVKDPSQPFFLGVGYHKPHVPFKYPQEYQALYPLEEIEIAPNPDLPPKLPPVAFEPYLSLMERDDIGSLNISFPYGPIPRPYHYLLRQNYYAAATYTDFQVGRLLQGLEDSGFANNTIVVFVGDHGWQLGEHSEWCKFSNFELATRVPLMVHVPGVTDRRKQLGTKKFPLMDLLKNSKLRDKRYSTGFKGGKFVNEFVELVDMFPTLSELAGLKVPSTCPPNPFKIDFCTEGVSFAPLITGAGGREGVYYARWKNATFSQYPRPGDVPTYESDLPHLVNITIMGYSMCTRDYHFTEWIGFNHSTFQGDWEDVHARELYVLASDPQEDDNVADSLEYQDLVNDLHMRLKRGWRDSLPVVHSDN